jgi:hypothetical protein
MHNPIGDGAVSVKDWHLPVFQVASALLVELIF